MTLRESDPWVERVFCLRFISFSPYIASCYRLPLPAFSFFTFILSLVCIHGVFGPLV